MRDPVLRLMSDELIVDCFAGGGGASLGIETALGRSPDIAINHDREAIEMHKTNHPNTEHYIEDIYDVDPTAVCKGRSVGLAWFSPDCTEHSKAKNSSIKRDKKIRCLADIVLLWARTVRPRVIMGECVEELQMWGPLDENGFIDKNRQGESWEFWCASLRRMGYKLSIRVLKACEFGSPLMPAAPTSRKRLYWVARCDGYDPEAMWPEPTNGPGRALPFRTAAECIDYSLPCPSIFMTKREARAFTKKTGIKIKRPLADKTMARIRRGLFKYVLGAAKPFTVRLTGPDDRIYDIDEPMRTVTCAPRGEFSLVQPVISRYNGESDGGGNDRSSSSDEPLGTVTTANRFAVVSPMVTPVKTWGGGGNEAAPADRPLRTVTTSKRGEYAVVTPYMAQVAYGEGNGKTRRRGKGTATLDEPLPTVTGSNTHALVAPTLVQTGYGERPGQKPRCLDLNEPLGTVIAGGAGNGNGKHAVVQSRLERVAAWIYKGYGGEDSAKRKGGFAGAAAIDKPLGTVTCQDHNHLAVSHMMKLRGTSEGHMDASSLPAESPVPTVSAGGTHVAEVRTFLQKYYGEGHDQGDDIQQPLDTVTTKDRFGIVTVEGEDYQIVDIGMRMLEPRELFRAQGFPDSYIIDPVIQVKKNGRIKRLSKTGQVEKCGNSVCPPMACAIVLSAFPLQHRLTKKVA